MESSSSPTVFQTLRYYVKELIVKALHTPLIFASQEPPTVDLKFQIHTQALVTYQYEVTLLGQVTVTRGEQMALLLEAQQAGLFHLAGYNEASLDFLLKAYCPNLLYPYFCRLVADAVTQAGFSSLVLSPINFEQHYQQQAKLNAATNNNSA